ncbi:MAG: hypothetical protein KJ018_22225 [Burkholderiales bacterium]|nr:hypothetical protein [Burkholderiales bacterium]
MRFTSVLAASALALAAIAAQPAAAQNCAGFTDVQAASPFCPSVEWMKNRAVTTGCTGTEYCPDDAVSRLAMAAFMQRLGVALTPAFVRKRDPAIGGLNLVGQQNLCATDPVAITGYPRAAIVRGLVNLYTPNGGMDVKAWVVYSTNGGTSWITPASNDGTAYGSLYSGLTPPGDISLHPMNVLDLDVGSTYQFALAVIRQTGTGDVANLYCENLVQLVNRNGTAPGPLDAPADAGPHGRGD